MGAPRSSHVGSIYRVRHSLDDLPSGPYSDLAVDRGCPLPSRKFPNDVFAAGAADYVLPISLDSLNA